MQAHGGSGQASQIAGEAADKHARKSSHSKASSSGKKSPSAAARRVARKTPQNATKSLAETTEPNRRGSSPRRVSKSPQQPDAPVREEPSQSQRRRRRTASPMKDGSGKNTTQAGEVRRRLRGSSAGAVLGERDAGKDGSAEAQWRGGRKHRQLEAIAAGMLEKDAGEQGAAAKGAKAKDRVRLPSYKDMESLVKQRRAGEVPHMDLTFEEGTRVAAHLTAFSKSAKMRDSARALYINNQVGSPVS